MADETRELEIVLKARNEASAELQRAGSDLERLSGNFKSIGSDLTSTGRSLSLGLTLPIAALGTTVATVGISYENAMQTIIAGTGAAASEVAGFEKVFKDVAKTVPQSLGTVAEVIRQLNSRLDLTDNALEEASRSVLQYAKVNNVDAAQSVKGLGQLIASLGVEVEDIPLLLDKLTFASQRTGIEVDQLAAFIVEAGPAFTELGFDVDRSIALFAQFEKFGARPQEVMSSLNITLRKLASEGFTDAQGAFEEYIRRIKDAPTLLEGVRVANDLFGRSAGKVAEDIRAGRFETEEFTQAIAEAQGTVSRTDELTTTFGETMGELKNQIILAVEPLGVAFLGALKSFVPLLERAIPIMQKMADWFAALPVGVQQGIIVFFALIAALGPVLIILGTLLSSVGTIITAVGSLWTIFTAVVGFITGVLIPGIGALVAIIGGPLTLIILAIIALVGLLLLAWKNNWFGIRDITNQIVTWFKTVILPQITAFFELVKLAVQNWVGSWVESWNKAKEVVMGVVDAIQQFINKAKEAASKAIGGFKIPGFQQGGFVPQTGLGLLHRGEFIASKDMLEGRKQLPTSVSEIFNQPINVQANVSNNLDLDLLGDKLAFALRNSR